MRRFVEHGFHGFHGFYWGEHGESCWCVMCRFSEHELHGFDELYSIKNWEFWILRWRGTLIQLRIMNFELWGEVGWPRKQLLVPWCVGFSNTDCTDLTDRVLRTRRDKWCVMRRVFEHELHGFDELYSIKNWEFWILRWRGTLIQLRIMNFEFWGEVGWSRRQLLILNSKFIIRASS